MRKLYFREDNDEDCYQKKDILESMKEDGINELKVFEAKRAVWEGYFYCNVFQEVWEVGESCGRFCQDYKPRNGKNGRCRSSGSCYEQTDKFIILKINN